MKRFIGVLLAVISFTGVCFSQAFPNYPLPSSNTFSAGIFFSPNYNYGGNDTVGPLRVTTGTSVTGAGTVTLSSGYLVTKDGRKYYPFGNSTNLPPIAIDSGANYEVVTPSAVSCSTPEIINTCQVTATFTYVHGAGAIVASGDQGIVEAQNDAAAKGGGNVFWVIDSGNLTLATGSQGTTFGNITIPTRSIIEGAVARVTTTITGCAGGWSLGYTTGVELTAANTTLTVGTTTDSSTIKVPLTFTVAAVAPEVYCTTGAATAGAVHARIWGIKTAAPSS